MRGGFYWETSCQRWGEGLLLRNLLPTLRMRGLLSRILPLMLRMRGWDEEVSTEEPTAGRGTSTEELALYCGSRVTEIQWLKPGCCVRGWWALLRMSAFLPWLPTVKVCTMVTFTVWSYCQAEMQYYTEFSITMAIKKCLIFHRTRYLLALKVSMLLSNAKLHRGGGFLVLKNMFSCMETKRWYTDSKRRQRNPQQILAQCLAASTTRKHEVRRKVVLLFDLPPATISTPLLPARSKQMGVQV